MVIKCVYQMSTKILAISQNLMLTFEYTILAIRTNELARIKRGKGNIVLNSEFVSTTLLVALI